MTSYVPCCHWIMTENDITKWTNECTNCEVPGRDGQNSFIPWYLLSALKIYLYEIFRWPLTWPRYRSKVRKRSNCYFALNFWRNFTKLIPEDVYSKPHRTYVWDKRFDLFSLGHVTLKLSVRSLYIEKLEFGQYLCISKQALVLQAKNTGSNHYFMI